MKLDTVKDASWLDENSCHIWCTDDLTRALDFSYDSMGDILELDIDENKFNPISEHVCKKIIKNWDDFGSSDSFDAKVCNYLIRNGYTAIWFSLSNGSYDYEIIDRNIIQGVSVAKKFDDPDELEEACNELLRLCGC